MTSRNSRLPMRLLATLVALGAASMAVAEPEVVAAEISVESAYAGGCVDCHDGAAVPTIGALLEEMGHANVDDEIETLPGDCAACHSEAGGMWFLSEIAHMAHFRNPVANGFVQNYGGECRHCHLMDGETGAVKVKSGPKNW